MKCNLIIELPERSRSICASGGGRALLNIQWHVQVCVLCIGWIQTFRTSILTKYRESWIHIRDLKKIWKMMITLFFIAMFYYFSTIEGKKIFSRLWGIEESLGTSMSKIVHEIPCCDFDDASRKEEKIKLMTTGRSKHTFHVMRHYKYTEHSSFYRSCLSYATSADLIFELIIRWKENIWLRLSTFAIYSWKEKNIFIFGSAW